MAHVLIRNLDPGIVNRLREHARRHGRLLQAELTVILEQAASPEPAKFGDLAGELRRRLAGREHSDSVQILAEDRGR